jgi:hypothetical protein
MRDRRRLRITGSISGDRVGIRSNHFRHEGLSGLVQSLNGISVTPVVGSDVGEASCLENPLRLDTTFGKEVTKESSDVSGLGSREVRGTKDVLVLVTLGFGAAQHGRLVMTVIITTVLTTEKLADTRLLKNRKSSARGGGEKPSSAQVRWPSAACRRTLRDPRRTLENRRRRVGKMLSPVSSLLQNLFECIEAMLWPSKQTIAGRTFISRMGR